MAIKKVMVALGLVCVVAPAALASAVLMARQGALPAGQKTDAALEQLIASLQELIDGRGAVAEVAGPDGPGDGVSRLPFRAAKGDAPRLSDIIWRFDLDAAEEALAGDSAVLASGMIPGSAGPAGSQETEGTGRSDASNRGSSASSGAPNGAGGVFAGGGGFGASGGAPGGGAAGDDATELALAFEPNQPSEEPGVAASENFSVMPLPASVWMLLASMVGLFVIGYQRRRRPF